MAAQETNRQPSDIGPSARNSGSHAKDLVNAKLAMRALALEALADLGMSKAQIARYLGITIGELESLQR